MKNGKIIKPGINHPAWHKAGRTKSQIEHEVRQAYIYIYIYVYISYISTPLQIFYEVIFISN